jgi:hypothetical protein
VRGDRQLRLEGSPVGMKPPADDVVDVGRIANYRSAVRVVAPFPHLPDLGGQSHVLHDAMVH